MNTPLILLIETATNICSCALLLGEEVVAYQESDVPNAHSKCLSVMIDNLFKQSGYAYKDLSAVAVSKGPGSYTGLRIGVSTAKGICYALDLPLISIPTLSILA
ncbi:MAG: tRNA (adenosine(37)-N6)-threonylcarbamoyltransferase complex dimerization subunit type 1 TsaB, partial [Bacteroidales bacterium]|nr:tRNA (adenosine(37)-N6)-threonylcarbamoyltransferase complex dimerization subunit type 1 TsaB [Bacteroidales bacterium]